MKKKNRSNVTLPKKQLTTKVKFEQVVPCALKMALNGMNPEIATEQQKKDYELDSCLHPLWPPFMPQCEGCLAKNKHDVVMIDKDGRESKITFSK